MKRLTSIAFTILILPNVAFAQNCPAPNSSINAIERDIAFAEAAPLNVVKDEFETTAQYEARRARLSSSTDAFWLNDPHLVESELVYNADAGQFEIELNSLAADLSAYRDKKLTELQRSGLDIKEYNRSANLGFTKHVKSKQMMQNGFGASFEVEKVDTDNFRVFDRPVSSILENDLWQPDFSKSEEKDRGGYKYTQNKKYISIQIEPEKARTLKPQMRGAILLRPKSPYRIETSSIASSFPPAPDFPYIWSDTYQVIIADILCYAFTDSAGRVIKTVEAAP
jgi:hypothetical protein